MATMPSRTRSCEENYIEEISYENPPRDPYLYIYPINNSIDPLMLIDSPY